MTSEEFELLLKWLDPDRDRAGEKYEAIRHRLMTFFHARGCKEADKLTDDAITRVACILPRLIDDYRGDPTYYFHGVARKVLQEYLRSGPRTMRTPPPPPAGWTEQEYLCLEKCMGELAPHTRRIFEEYYCGGKSGREGLAVQSGMTLNALRINVHRARAKLKACVEECLEREGE